MITSVRVIWLVNEEEEEARYQYLIGEQKKKKRNAVAMSNIQLICIGNNDG
jgi:hypothetical protein